MSIAPLPARVLARDPPRFRLAPLALTVWASVAASLLFLHARVFDSMSMDDFMRLAEVRDFLAGQGWFDLTQYRLHPPAGIVMHWSRLVDLPIAALIALLSPLAGRETAEAVTSAAWPLFLFLPALLLAGMIARRLAGGHAALPALLLVAVCAPVLVHFRPGALDHHGIQLVLLLATIYGLMQTDGSRVWPLLAGIAAALSLAIGLEMAPALGALLAAAGLRWVLEGRAAAKLVFAFGLAFGGGTALLFAATVPFSEWSAAVCDRISPASVAAAGMSGGLLALLASSTLDRPRTRLLAAAAAGIVAIALTALAFPACLRDPYAQLDERLASLWLASVAEAQNFFEFVHNAPADAAANYGAPLAALVLAALAVLRLPRERRTAWIAPYFAALALFAVSLWEIRGAGGANIAAIPLAAAAVVLLFGGGPSLSNPRAMLVLLALSTPVLALLGKAGVKTATFFHAAPGTLYSGGPLACRELESVAPLAKLPPALVLSHLDLGPMILAGTRHGVLAAPYHRNIDGNRAAFEILLSGDAEARRLLHEHHVAYVAICPGAPERFNLQQIAPDGLSERLARGEVPPYLEPVAQDPNATLRVFRVR